MLQIHHCRDFASMSEKTVQTIAAEINSAKKQFCMALPGGNSVSGVLESLRSQKIMWQAVNVFMADERLVAPADKDSNFRQANELLFSKVAGVHAFPFKMDEGLSAYQSKFLFVTKGNLDLVVLGVGEDGHIASLFPNHAALKNKAEGYIEVKGAPKPPAERISLSPKAIEGAGAVILLFASESKRQAFEKFMDKKVSASQCPAKIALKAKRAFVFTVFGGKNAG